VVTSNVTMHLLHEVDRIRPLIQAHATSAEEHRQLASAVYEAMDEAGLFAMLAPKAYGGLELHPVEAMRVWESIARIDSAAAWNLVMNQAVAAYAAWLPAEGAHELFRDGPTTVGGALNPPAAAIRVEGGWRITGQCPFGSGCHNATWLAMPAVEMDGDHPKVDPATGRSTSFGGLFSSRRSDDSGHVAHRWHARYGLDGLRGARPVCSRSPCCASGAAQESGARF
jgi:alkylation response protein AidB-like acyl-CoA dehydrogenase